MAMNVFKDFPYRKRYYLLHPHVWIKHALSNLKDAWDRATKGYCGLDLWNMDQWLVEILPQMLRQLARDSHGYPGVEPFETPEKWKNWLVDAAARLETSMLKDFDDRNPYLADYMKLLNTCTFALTEKRDDGSNVVKFHHNQEEEELSKKYFAAEKKLAEELKVERTKVLSEIIEYLDFLWD